MSWTTLLTSAVIAAVVAGLFTLINNRVNLYSTHKLEQQKELKSLIGAYHGRMLEAAIDWDRRMRRMYQPNGTDHMSPYGGRYNHSEYDYLSVVFRFLSLLGIARKFESHAFYIDSRIARHKDLEFVRFAKSFLWVMTDSKLTPDDDMPGIDHFRNDEFRPLLDACYRRESGVLPENEPQVGEIVFDWQRFRALLDKSRPAEDDGRGKVMSKVREIIGKEKDDLDKDTQEEMQQVLGFFDAIRPNEYDGDRKRRRWERIICLHLLTICFIGTFGYSWQRDKSEIHKKRNEALTALRKEALAPSKHISVLEAFNENLHIIGMDGQAQVKKLKRDLANAITGLPDR